jgi:hypothetical protein
MFKRAIHVGTAAIALVVVVAGSGACAAPEFTYVKNSGQKTYFKVPHEWHSTVTKSLDDVLSGTNPDSANSQARQQQWWSVAYDADVDPAADHLISQSPTDQPILYARISPLSTAQQNEVSLDMLRNAFLPVTDDARQAAEESAGAGGTGLTGFELVNDQVLTPANGLRGVRVVYDYELGGGVLHTFDQTALVNNDGSKLYLLIIRCSTSCYRARSGELDTIAKSFTVRSN